MNGNIAHAITTVTLRLAACLALLGTTLPLAGCSSVDDGGSSGTGGSGATHMDLGEGDGQDVVTIGDSYMSLILSGIQQSLGGSAAAITETTPCPER